MEYTTERRTLRSAVLRGLILALLYLLLPSTALGATREVEVELRDRVNVRATIDHEAVDGIHLGVGVGTDGVSVRARMDYDGGMAIVWENRFDFASPAKVNEARASIRVPMRRHLDFELGDTVTRVPMWHAAQPDGTVAVGYARQTFVAFHWEGPVNVGLKVERRGASISLGRRW